VSDAHSRVAGIERGPFACAVIGGSVLLTALAEHAPLWVSAVVAVPLLSLVTVRVYGRTVVRWFIDWAEYRFGRERRIHEVANPPQVRDIEVAGGVCGIQYDGDTLVAMIQLAPNLDLPTVISEQTIYTEDTVRVDDLVPMLDQYGVAVDIDVVTTGQRVRPAGSYSILYDQLIGSHPVVGNRLTWLVVRLDQQRNLPVLSGRGPCEVVAPKALATAAHRIAVRLRERGTSAHALPADAVLDAARVLHAGMEPTELQEHWSCLSTSVPGRFVTTFGIDWSQLDETGLDDCWTWNNGRTTLVVSVAEEGPRALVRYVGPAMSEALPEYLRRLPGRQVTALSATLASATSVRTLPGAEKGAEYAPEEMRAGLSVAIGPNGQILGSISGQSRNTLAMPLFDPARYNPRRRAIDVHATLPVAQQLVLRATVVGADVEVHTNRPQRWQQLVSAVGDPRSLRLVQENDRMPDGSDAMIAVFDQLPPQGSAAPTTVAVSEPGARRRRAVDLAIEQVSPTAVDVRIPMRTVRVDLIEPRGETRYFDAPEASPPVPQALSDPAPAAPTSPVDRGDSPRVG